MRLVKIFGLTILSVMITLAINADLAFSKPNNKNKGGKSNHQQMKHIKGASNDKNSKGQFGKGSRGGKSRSQQMEQRNGDRFDKNSRGNFAKGSDDDENEVADQNNESGDIGGRRNGGREKGGQRGGENRRSRTTDFQSGLGGFSGNCDHLPPGLRKNGHYPPGLAKQGKVPPGWSKKCK